MNYATKTSGEKGFYSSPPGQLPATKCPN